MKVSNKPNSYVGDRFRATRPLDYIYDPLFTFSGPKGFYKTAHESFQLSSSFSVQPIFDSMFSDMVRYPRATLVLQPSHQVPQSIDTSYRGKIKATSQERTVTVEVTGTDRYKYFRRPVTDTQTGSPSTSRFPLLELGLMAPPTTAQNLHDRSARLSAATQTRAAQTDFRDTETQTRPWTPPYVTHGSDTPEVLHLDQLTWGKGLPPGQHEVDIIERLRRKQAWEAQLPPLDTQANIKKRFKLIEDIEKNEWKFREKEIEAIHEQRMKKSEQLLEQHMLLNRTRLSYRMEFLEDDMNKRKEKKLEIIRHEKERALRKLCMKEKGYNPKYHKMNIIDEYLQHKSEIYAPMKRFGTSFKNRHEKLAEKHIVIDKRDLSTVENLAENQLGFDYNKASKPKKKTELCVRETRWTMENLAKLHQDLQSLRAKQGKKEDAFYTNAVEHIVKPQKAPEIPSVPLIQESEERLYQAATLIQRVILGRAMQVQMFQGQQRWREVMKEMKSVETMTAQQRALFAAQEDRTRFESRQAGVMENIIGQNVGMSIGQTLELLATELMQFRNEGIAHSQALDSECERWRREVPEGGLRQKEMRRREEHNLMFAQLLQVYQDSVNEFLQDLVSRSREQAAKAEAYEYAKEVALLPDLKAAEDALIEEEPVSADLLFEFIAPEGLRELARTCMLILKQKYKEARVCLAQTGRAAPLSDDNVSQRDSELKPLSASSSQNFPGVDFSVASSSVFSYCYSDAGATSSIQTEAFVIPEPSPSTGGSQLNKEDGLESTSLPNTAPDLARFGLVTGASPEARLLTRIMRDMCYVAGALLHSAARILNTALHLSNIPQETFEEALRRTMLVINEAREEIARLILPKQQTEPPKLASQFASEEVIAKARNIVEEILSKAKTKIEEKRLLRMSSTDVRIVPKIVIESEVHMEAEKLVEDVIKDAQRRVFQTVVEDFLSDLLTEVDKRVNLIKGDLQQDSELDK